MGDFNKVDHLKIRQLENELKEVKKELDQLKAAGGGAVENGQMAKRLAQLEMADRARRFSSTLPPPNSDRKIVLQNGHKFTSDFDAFIRNGAAYCQALTILRGPNDSAFHGYPPEFFNELIKHFHASENLDEMVASVNIALALDNPARWPAALVQLHAAHFGWISKEQLEKDGMPTLTEEEIDYDDKMVEYTMGNKHKPEARFKLRIHFEGVARCHQQMTRFAACRTDDIITSAGNKVEHGEGEQKERKLEEELQQVNAKNAKLEKEMWEMKEQLGNKNLELESELQELNTKNGKLEKEMREMKDQLRSKNLELLMLNAKNEKLEKELGEIKDPLDEVKIDQIVIGYTRTLPAPDSEGCIILRNGHHYTPTMDIFLRYGAAHCNWFIISRDTNDGGFVGYPANFFDDLIKYYCETKVSEKAVRDLVIELSRAKPAPWPAALVQPQAGKMNVEVLKVDNVGKCVEYILRNKHNPGIAFKLWVYFQGSAKYQQMTSFVMEMDVEARGLIGLADA